jgi:hypothetical protein
MMTWPMGTWLTWTSRVTLDSPPSDHDQPTRPVSHFSFGLVEIHAGAVVRELVSQTRVDGLIDVGFVGPRRVRDRGLFTLNELVNLALLVIHQHHQDVVQVEKLLHRAT